MPQLRLEVILLVLVNLLDLVMGAIVTIMAIKPSLDSHIRTNLVGSFCDRSPSKMSKILLSC